MKTLFQIAISAPPPPSPKFLSSSNYLCFSLLSPSELLCSFQFSDQGVLGSSEAAWSISCCIKYFEHAERWSSLLRDGSLNKCKMLKNNNTSHPECSTTSRIRVNIIWGWNVTCVQPKWWIPTFYPLSISFLFPIGIIFPLAPLPQFYITTYWPFLLHSVDKEEMALEKLLREKKESPFSCVVILEEFYNASF